jgi:hypothetical protein
VVVAIAAEFLRAVRSAGSADSTGSAGSELLPSRLAAACTEVLPVAGVGISLFGSSGVRIPVGASSGDAATAERLQFTAAQGPCLDAHTSARPVLATESLIAYRWPLFHAGLVSRTPFRAVTAVPMTGLLTGLGTVDLFFRRSSDLAVLDMTDAGAVVTELVRCLAADGVFRAAANPWPVWLDGPLSAPRSAVFIAMGMLNVALGLASQDALALLRAHAYTTDRSVDDIAGDLVNRRIDTEELRLDTST